MTDCWGDVEWMRAIAWTAGVFFVGMSAAFELTRRRYKRKLEESEALMRAKLAIAEQVFSNVRNSTDQH